MRATTPESAPTDRAPPLSPAEEARQAVSRVEHAFDRLVLRSTLYPDEIAEAREALRGLYTLIQTLDERCRV
jgi:hypothetical protein